MPKVTITLNIAVECDDPDEALPLLKRKVQELAEALKDVEESGPEVLVTLPHVTVEQTPEWSPGPGPGPGLANR